MVQVSRVKRQVELAFPERQKVDKRCGVRPTGKSDENAVFVLDKRMAPVEAVHAVEDLLGDLQINRRKYTLLYS